MNDLKIPNLNIKSKQYLFKNKIPITRKSRLKLVQEAIFMLTLASLILSINYSITGKIKLFNSFIPNLNNIIIEFIKIIGYAYEILIVVFLLASFFFALILIAGALYRFYRAIRRKSKRINF